VPPHLSRCALCCSENEVGTEGTVRLAEALARNNTLTSLNLDCTEAGGLSRWATPIDMSSCSANCVGSEGAAGLAQALQHNSTLSLLALAGTRRVGMGKPSVANGLTWAHI